MSSTTMATSGGFPHTHAVNENKARCHASLKGKGRTGQLQSRQGKTIQLLQGPLATPRKALYEIQNTPVQKPTGHNTRPSQLSITKPEKKLLAKESNSSKHKSKRVSAKGTGVLPTRAHRKVTRSSVNVQEEDDFPDIETVPERVDEFEQDRLFIPPSYFDSLTTALKSIHIPPTWRSLPTDVSASLQLDLDTIGRPTNFSSDSSLLAPLGCSLAEDVLSVKLPDLEDL